MTLTERSRERGQRHGEAYRKERSRLGIKGKLLQWMENFLTSRTMRVGIRGTLSLIQLVLSGVPRGSILGPLLFLMFVNELPLWIKSEMRMFADDTKVWYRIKSEKDSIALQEDLDKLSSWSDILQLTFNAENVKLCILAILVEQITI